MNINLNPSVETSKLAKAASSDADTIESADKGSEEEGFFAKLSALFKGEDSESKSKPVASEKSENAEKAALKESLKQVDVESVEGSEAAEHKGEALDVDAKLSSEQIDELAAKNDSPKTANDTPTDADSRPDAVAVKDKLQADSSASRQQAMKDGDTVLQRLKQANQVLPKDSGKALPPADQVQQIHASSDDESVLIQDELPLAHHEHLPESQARIKAAKMDNEFVGEQSEKLRQSELIAASAGDNDLPPHMMGQAVQLQKDVSPKKDMLSEQEAMAVKQQFINQQVERLGKQDVSELTDDELADIMVALAVFEQTQFASQPKVDVLASNDLNTPIARTIKPEAQSIDVTRAQGQRENNLSSLPMAKMAAALSASTALSNETSANVVSQIKPNQLDALITSTYGNDLSPEQFEAVKLSMLKKMQHESAVMNMPQQPLTSHATQTFAVDKANVDTSLLNTPQAQAAGVTSAAGLAAAAFAAQHGTQEMRESQLFAKRQSDPRLNGVGDIKSSELSMGKEQNSFAQHAMTSQGAQSLQSSLSRFEGQVTNTPLHLARDNAADQLAEKVQMMMSKNLKNIDIRLDPPELGRMHIRMNMAGDATTVHFSVANAHARDVLEQSMPRLREMLSQNGVQLGDTSVQQQSSGQQQGYASARGGNGNGTNGGFNTDGMLISDENIDTEAKVTWNVGLKRDGISYYA